MASVWGRSTRKRRCERARHSTQSLPCGYEGVRSPTLRTPSSPTGDERYATLELEHAWLHGARDGDVVRFSDRAHELWQLVDGEAGGGVAARLM